MRTIVRSINDLTGVLSILLLVLSTSSSGAEDMAAEVRANQRQVFWTT